MDSHKNNLMATVTIDTKTLGSNYNPKIGESTDRNLFATEIDWTENNSKGEVVTRIITTGGKAAEADQSWDVGRRAIG